MADGCIGTLYGWISLLMPEGYIFTTEQSFHQFENLIYEHYAGQHIHKDKNLTERALRPFFGPFGPKSYITNGATMKVLAHTRCTRWFSDCASPYTGRQRYWVNTHIAIEESLLASQQFIDSKLVSEVMLTTASIFVFKVSPLMVGYYSWMRGL